MADSGEFGRMCPYCGATASRRLGDCSVCRRIVCEKCGNVQYSHGARTATHNSCLRKADGGFKMIKFVD